MGTIKEYVLEIKPYAQSVKPKPPKRRTAKAMRNFRNLQVVVKKNEFKWEAAERYCKKRGWVFKVITENELHI